MTNNDPLSNVLSQIHNAEQRGKREVITEIDSKIIRRVLDLMNEAGYIGQYEEADETKGLKVHLTGRLNECNAIKPRFKCSMDDYTKYEQRYLPAQDFGIMLISTNEGILTHQAAKDKGKGGRLISYAY